MAEIFRNDGTTPVCADWLNGVDDTVNDALGGADTPTQARLNIGAIGEAPTDTAVYGRQNGTWVVVSSSGGTPIGDFIYRAPPTATVNKISVASNPTFVPLEIEIDSAQSVNAFTVTKQNDPDQLVWISKSGAFHVGPTSAGDPTDPSPRPAFSIGEGFCSVVGMNRRNIPVGGQNALLRVNPDNNSRGIAVFMDNAPSVNLDAFSVWGRSGTTWYETVQIQGDGTIVSGQSPEGTGVVTLETKGPSAARIEIIRKADGTTPMLTCTAGTVLSDNPNYLKYWAYKPGQYTNSNENVFEITRKPSNRGGTEFPMVQSYVARGDYSVAGCLSLGHAYIASGAVDGYWTLKPGGVAPTAKNFVLYYLDGIASGRPPTGNPQFRLDSSGNTTITGTYYQVSDMGAKVQVTDAPSELAKIKQLRVCSYINTLTRSPEVGLLVQEVKTIIPDVCHEHLKDEQYDSLSYVSLIPYLIKAFQELAHDVDTLRAGSTANP
jgi:hypothetical protein